MTILALSPKTAEVYRYICSVRQPGDRLPTLTEIANVIPVPMTTIRSSLIRLAQVGILHGEMTPKPPLIRIYYLLRNDVNYVILARYNRPDKQTECVARSAIIHNDQWEMAAFYGY